MKSKILVFATCILSVLLISCKSNKQTTEALSNDEIKQIKTEIIESIANHIEVLKRLDYEEAMKFYTKENYMVFGDGKYWGDYSTVDDIWKTWLPRWKAITKWDLKNQKVHVFSRKSAIAYVEWDHARIEEDGSDTKAYGFWVFGMQRFQEGWKAVNSAIDHRYTIKNGD
ncbi:MAG: nuclear transport factor 2 family protein [Flavobacteriaceae bacterium]